MVQKAKTDVLLILKYCPFFSVLVNSLSLQLSDVQQSFKFFPNPLSWCSLQMTLKVFPQFLQQALSDNVLFSKDKSIMI